MCWIVLICVCKIALFANKRTKWFVWTGMIIQINLYLFAMKTEGCAAIIEDHLPIGIDKHPPPPATWLFPERSFPKVEHDVSLSCEENSGEEFQCISKEISKRSQWSVPFEEHENSSTIGSSPYYRPPVYNLNRGWGSRPNISPLWAQNFAFQWYMKVFLFAFLVKNRVSKNAIPKIHQVSLQNYTTQCFPTGMLSSKIVAHISIQSPTALGFPDIQGLP